MDGAWDFGNLRFWKNVQVPFFKIPQQICVENARPWCVQFPKKMVIKITDFKMFRSLHLAILMIFWHKWEARSRKVSMTAVNFSPSPWNFWPVMSQVIRKSCFSTSIPRGQNLARLVPEHVLDSGIGFWYQILVPESSNEIPVPSYGARILVPDSGARPVTRILVHVPDFGTIILVWHQHMTSNRVNRAHWPTIKIGE